ncbi:hypothetical protein [Natronococcus occultus]|uniref:Uncharacterized protein n=2 Tax=Natronococcus TaxID=29287 RepID=L0JZ27_9EURY|nr:hypothetical protein [Natronococcus occultus]AGB37339.1 hypothetical protein Natoc_1532 [Natronococcus occultus SP4]
MSTDNNSLERYRQWIIAGTAALKIGLVVYGVWVTLAVYQAGLE